MDKVPNHIKLPIGDVRHMYALLLSGIHKGLGSMYGIMLVANCQPPGSGNHGDATGVTGNDGPGNSELGATPDTDKLIASFQDRPDGKRPIYLIDALRAVERLRNFVEKYYVHSDSESIE